MKSNNVRQLTGVTQRIFWIFSRRTMILRVGMGWLVLAGLTGAPQVQAQWVAYTFSPQVAYRSSYGFATNTPGSAAYIQTLGWPTEWNDSSLRGVLAVYFTTNTNSPGAIALLPPLIYANDRSSTNTISTNNYTNIPLLAFTNTNVSGANSILDPLSYMGRFQYGPATYMVASFSSLLINGSEARTNVLGSFQLLCSPYRTNLIGTNGVPAGTNYYPTTWDLRLNVLGRAGDTGPFTNSKQLVLPLTLNPTLTKLINTNSLFGAAALTDPLAPSSALQTNAVYTNLPKLIRSNSTYANP